MLATLNSWNIKYNWNKMISDKSLKKNTIAQCIAGYVKRFQFVIKISLFLGLTTYTRRIEWWGYVCVQY